MLSLLLLLTEPRLTLNMFGFCLVPAPVAKLLVASCFFVLAPLLLKLYTNSNWVNPPVSFQHLFLPICLIPSCCQLWPVIRRTQHHRCRLHICQSTSETCWRCHWLNGLNDRESLGINGHSSKIPYRFKMLLSMKGMISFSNQLFLELVQGKFIGAPFVWWQFPLEKTGWVRLNSTTKRDSQSVQATQNHLISGGFNYPLVN